MIFSNHIKNTDGSNNGDWNMVEFPDVGAMTLDMLKENVFGFADFE